MDKMPCRITDDPHSAYENEHEPQDDEIFWERTVEADKRVSEIDWSWAVSQIDAVVNAKMTQVETDDRIGPEGKQRRVVEIEKAWQRILLG
jgi:hypothetical protein|tara:strand:- start:41 stop:313 length:273 start_codon:yes stop_codon:yes gene_type:complete